MNTVSTAPQANINEAMSTIDALWTIIAAQPKKVRKALAIRLQNELAAPAKKKTGLEEAMEDVRMGRVSGPFSTTEELFEHLGI